MIKNISIGIVGQSSAGKDTVAEYLQKKQFSHISLSDIVREIARKRGSYRSRDDLIRIANEHRKRYGPGYFGKKALERSIKRKYQKIVFSSIRNPSEITALKQDSNFFTIAITAPLSVRYKRVMKRGKIGDDVSFAKFKAQEAFERNGARHQQQLDAVIAMADYTIVNNSTKQALYKKIDAVIENIEQQIMKRMVLNIIILGPQGSGKGTQASVLADKYSLHRIETGKIFRTLAKQRTVIGRKVNYIINVQGRLVPSKFVIEVLKHELHKVSMKRGLLFDGFPRDVVQARALDKLLIKMGRSLTHVFYIPVSHATTIKRLSLRRTCAQCNSIFIYGVDIKKGAMKCKKCEGNIYQREDDKPRAISERLKQYRQRTKPVVSFYKKQNVLYTVDGEPSILVVSKNILMHLPKK